MTEEGIMLTAVFGTGFLLMIVTGLLALWQEVKREKKGEQ